MQEKSRIEAHGIGPQAIHHLLQEEKSVPPRVGADLRQVSVVLVETQLSGLIGPKEVRVLFVAVKE
jgi:hypothetical protein